MRKYPKVYCFVTNDLNQDQRMHRICQSIYDLGIEVWLIGREKQDSKPLLAWPFAQKRIKCFLNKGFLFYLEYNIRILLMLLNSKEVVIYCVDTDTLLACSVAKRIKHFKLIFDSHEYFTEVPELHGKPIKKKIWQLVEKWCIPLADTAITVSESLGKVLESKYGKQFTTIYNAPSINAYKNLFVNMDTNMPFILYQGVLNKGRGLEAIIDAMVWIDDVRLVIAGEGDLSRALKQRAEKSIVSQRISFVGWLMPDELRQLTVNATLGINLLDGSSLNYYYSLANKFFDYMHAGVPSLNMNFPEYKHLTEQYDVGYLTDNLVPEQLAQMINHALNDKVVYALKKENCLKASLKLNWENENVTLKKLILSVSCKS